MTPVRISIAAAVGSVILILIVLELIRGRRLKERYALLWLVTGLALLVLSAWRGGLNTIAGWLGVSGYPPAILFAAAIMFVIAVLLHYSTVLSKLTDDNVLLAQEVALLRTRLDALEGAAAPADQLQHDQDEDHGADRGRYRDPYRCHGCAPSEGTAYRLPIATKSASVTLKA